MQHLMTQQLGLFFLARK
uniref:NERD domain-containing protein n=1 Tax=Arundo donax TaxID=35708 RepID=A0A0A9FK29_ARUDO